jgi:hypothetical protein
MDTPAMISTGAARIVTGGAMNNAGEFTDLI